MNEKTVMVGTRLKASTYSLLARISNATKLSKAMLMRAAVTQWLKNAPPDLPLELKVAIAHQLMKNNIETIKQLRWIYYASHDAALKIEYSEKHTGEKKSFPPHVREALRQLEHNIVNQQKMLDTWLKTQFSMRSDGSDVQNDNTPSEEP